MPAWTVARSGTRSAISAAIAWSRRIGLRPAGTSTSGRSVCDQPSDLADVHRVAPERPRHLLVDLQEDRPPTDERRDVVGVRARARSSRAGRAATLLRGSADAGSCARSSSGTSLKWAGTKSIPPEWKCGRVTGDRKYETCRSRCAVPAVEVAAVDQGVHLVDPDAVQGRSRRPR